MNFQSMKWMIESLVDSYKCPECDSTVNDSNVDIVWAAGTTINIDIACANCWKHSMIKSEVLSIDLSKWWISQENIEKLKKSLLNWSWKIITSQKLINDEEIIWLNKDLKNKTFNVSDLLWDNNKIDS